MAKSPYPKGYTNYDVFVADDGLHPAIFFKKCYATIANSASLAYGAFKGPQGYYRAGYMGIGMANSAALRIFQPHNLTIMLAPEPEKENEND